MTDLIARILADRALVRAFDDAQLDIIKGVLTAHLPAAPAVPAVAQPCGEIIAQPMTQPKPVPAASAPVVTKIAETPENRYVAYVDGACSGNPGPGGWAAYFPASQESLVGGEDLTTNNQMEIVAATAAIAATPAGALIEVFTDSQLVVQTMQGAWKRKTNIDLWARLDAACQGRTAIFTWVKGHAGHAAQEMSNDLAQREAQRRKAA